MLGFLVAIITIFLIVFGILLLMVLGMGGSMAILYFIFKCIKEAFDKNDRQTKSDFKVE